MSKKVIIFNPQIMYYYIIMIITTIIIYYLHRARQPTQLRFVALSTIFAVRLFATMRVL
jgi:hypothetical protein